MLRASLTVALFAMTPFACAQLPNLGQLKAQHPVQLSADELRQLLPGAKVVSVTNAGSTRRWTNRLDGTLSAGSDGRGVTGGRGVPSSAEGTWKIDDSGRWCVNIQWVGPRDDWCRYLLKAGDKYYGYDQLKDEATGSEFEISH